ncbi:hypothetical protein DFJ74DRAFT_652835 [Hyaloraphidium curvatum]|nr:hypothetical protein DFJ74DRAFT_652835 [Hyaloraphidium curvatum]
MQPPDAEQRHGAVGAGPAQPRLAGELRAGERRDDDGALEGGKERRGAEEALRGVGGHGGGDPALDGHGAEGDVGAHEGVRVREAVEVGVGGEVEGAGVAGGEGLAQLGGDAGRRGRDHGVEEGDLPTVGTLGGGLRAASGAGRELEGVDPRGGDEAAHALTEGAQVREEEDGGEVRRAPGKDRGKDVRGEPVRGDGVLGVAGHRAEIGHHPGDRRAGRPLEAQKGPGGGQVEDAVVHGEHELGPEEIVAHGPVHEMGGRGLVQRELCVQPDQQFRPQPVCRVQRRAFAHDGEALQWVRKDVPDDLEAALEQHRRRGGGLLRGHEDVQQEEHLRSLEVRRPRVARAEVTREQRVLGALAEEAAHADPLGGGEDRVRHVAHAVCGHGVHERQRWHLAVHDRACAREGLVEREAVHERGHGVVALEVGGQGGQQPRIRTRRAGRDGSGHVLRGTGVRRARRPPEGVLGVGW